MFLAAIYGMLVIFCHLQHFVHQMACLPQLLVDCSELFDIDGF